MVDHLQLLADTEPLVVGYTSHSIEFSQRVVVPKFTGPCPHCSRQLSSRIYELAGDAALAEFAH